MLSANKSGINASLLATFSLWDSVDRALVVSHKYSEGDLWNMDTKGNAVSSVCWTSQHGFSRNCVERANPVKRCRSGLWIKLCQPMQHTLLVDRAHWCGAVARSTISAICCSMVHVTKCLMTSPATIPLTPPSGLVKIVSRPERTMSTTI